MHEMTWGAGTMMWAMGITWLLLIVLVVLAIAALGRYLFSSRRD